MGDSGTLHADEAAELAQLQKQMMGDQVAGAPPQPNQNSAPFAQPEPNQQVPIPQYEPPPPELGAPNQNQGWNSQPAPQPQPQPQPDHQGTPPAGVIEERRRRQEAEQTASRTQQQLDETRMQLAKIEERTAMLGDVVARGQKAQLEDTPIPSWEEDPEGFIRETNKRAVQEAVAAQMKPLQDKQKEYDQVLEQESQEREIAKQLQAQAQAYERDHPDFRQAYDYYLAARRQDLISQGFAPERVVAHVDMEEKIMAQAHLQDGRNIPEAVYKAAVSRGYKPGQQQQQQPAPHQSQQAYQPAPQQQYAPQAPNYAINATNANAQPQQYAPPQPQQPYYSGQPGLDNMQAGMMAGSHLADVQHGNSTLPGIPTLEQLAQMPEDQLEANKAFVDAHLQGLQRAGH